MRVLVVGGYGLIGSAVVRRLHAGGHAVTGLGRSIGGAARAMPFAAWRRGDLRHLTVVGAWTAQLADFDAVVNCAGALQDNRRDDLAVVHGDAVLDLAEACAGAGLRFVHVSAIGANADARTRFMRTKAEAEAGLAAIDGDWLIVRPALVLGAEAYGGSALLRALSAFPGFIPAVHPDTVFQLVALDDVAEACAAALAPGAPSRTAIDLAHPDRTTVRDILLGLRAWLGLPPAPVIALPAPLAAPIGWIADALGWLGWRSPMRTTALAQLAVGVESNAPADPLGIPLKSLGDMLATWPAGAEARWFARLYLLKPLVFATLSAFWLTSGLIGLTVGRPAAVTVLLGRLNAGEAQAAVIAGGVADIALGLAALHRSSASWALNGMVAVSLAYLAGATLLVPALWADPLGSLVKIVPGLVLAIVALAILEER